MKGSEKSMEFPYTVNDLLSTFRISKTTFYNQVKKNPSFFNENSVRVREQDKKNKPSVKYNQSVFDFFASQYGTEEAHALLENASVGGTLLENEFVGGTSSPSFKFTSVGGTPTEAPEAPAIEEATAKEIDTLKAEIDALKRQLEQAEGERAELIKQNGNLLLLLNQEKAEKQLLLPEPKKSLSSRLKSLFRKKED